MDVSVEHLLLLVSTACLSLLYSRGSSRKAAHKKAVRKLGLVTKDGELFFEAIHKSGNRFLFRDHFRMNTEAFGALFDRCQPFISDAVCDQR
ncbi:Lactoylglutathione lyase [Phytophthora palmivora]|uniref:Lactoylglutathione lyase n=1 Tax=Phytophthora palmivora TaxID=4796 RepID=A0A2P4X2C9_9STRA|nr:Lactoylglutathione lyase [Phytophthora palmivora]